MGIPYGQALRLRRICESEMIFERRLGELRTYSLKGGFRIEVRSLMANYRRQEVLVGLPCYIRGLRVRVK